MRSGGEVRLPKSGLQPIATRRGNIAVPFSVVVLCLLVTASCGPSANHLGLSPTGAPGNGLGTTAGVTLVPADASTLTPWLAPATATPTLTLTPTPFPPTATPLPTPLPPTATPAGENLGPDSPPRRTFATFDEFWNGDAEWVLEKYDVGLPVGESDTVFWENGQFWSYLHASYQSAGVVDSCGDPVPFPGCVTLWVSYDGGTHFRLSERSCLFPCATCPCSPSDHTWQQQYPRVFFDGDRAYMVYEWGAGAHIRTSSDGLNWLREAYVPGSGIWNSDQRGCSETEAIGEHPHIYSELEFDCLAGAPPGIFIEGEKLYVFVGLGRAPGHMGCYVGDKAAGVWGLRKCASNPLFGADRGYGPVDVVGEEANPYFEFRTISSADVVRVGDRYYMTYEGVRGPSDPTVGDDQFGLALARSVGPSIDGQWEKYPDNPIIVDLPGNVGVGHADIVVIGDVTYLYTATSTSTRGRYVLMSR